MWIALDALGRDAPRPAERELRPGGVPEEPSRRPQRVDDRADAAARPDRRPRPRGRWADSAEEPLVRSQQVPRSVGEAGLPCLGCKRREEQRDARVASVQVVAPERTPGIAIAPGERPVGPTPRAGKDQVAQEPGRAER